MTKEKPLNIEQFYFSRNEIASQEGGKLELEAMSRVRQHMLDEQEQERLAQAERVAVKKAPKKEK